MARRFPIVLDRGYWDRDSVGHPDHAGSNRVPHLCGGAKQDKGERSWGRVRVRRGRSRSFSRLPVSAHRLAYPLGRERSVPSVNAHVSVHRLENKGRTKMEQTMETSPATAVVRIAPRRTKRRFTLWLEPQTASALKALAAHRAMPATVLAEDILRRGLSGIAEEQLDGPALPAVRQVIDEALKPHVERLAALIAKTHLEAGIAERLAYVLVAQAFGAEKAPQYLDAARTKAIEALKRPLGEQRPKE